MSASEDDPLIKTLYLEDDDDDAEELRTHLHAVRNLGGPRYFVTTLRQIGQASLYVAYEDYDVVICDYFLNVHGDYGTTCESFLGELRSRHPEIVTIVTSDSAELSLASPWLKQNISEGRIGFIWKGLWSPQSLHAVIRDTWLKTPNASPAVPPETCRP